MVNRAFYTLQAAAQHLKCSVADLLHLGGLGLLPVYANIAVADGDKRLALRGAKPVGHRRRQVVKEQPLSDDDDSIREEQKEARQIKPFLNGLTGKDTPIGLFWLFPQDVRRMETANGFSSRIASAARFDGRLLVYQFVTPVTVEPCNLVVLPNDLAAATKKSRQERVKPSAIDPESISERNLRWYGIWLQYGGPGVRGAQARAMKAISQAEHVSVHCAKEGMQRGRELHHGLERRGEVKPAPQPADPFERITRVLRPGKKRG